MAELKRKNAQLQARYEEIVNKAKEEAVEIVRSAKVEVEAVIKEIKEAQKKERREQEAAAQRARSSLKRLSDNVYQSGKGRKDKSGPKPHQIQPGRMVYLPNLRQKGEVLQKPDSNNEVIVQAGMIRLTVPLSEVSNR